MCGCESQPAYSASLKPPQGSPLGLQEGVTWIGRGTFEASLRAQLLCSRRQACFTLTETGLRIECHGINPLLFVVCHSKNVHGTEATPATELFQLRKGEAVDLANGDRFYFAAMECLLTVAIKQNDIAENLTDVLPVPLQKASEACVKENEESKLIENEQQAAEIPQALQDPAEDCGIGDPQLKNVPIFGADSPKTVAGFLCPDVAAPREFLAASKPSVSPTVICPVSRKCQYESVGNDQEDSDSLGLDAYDCLPLVGVSRLHVRKPLRCISPQRREELSDPAVAIDDDNRLNESYQSRGENLIEEALPNSTVDEVPEDGNCAQFPIDGEGCRPPCIQDDYQAIQTSLCSRDGAHGLEVGEDLPNEIRPFNEQREPEDYNLIMSSETVDGRPMEDELLRSEAARGLAVDNVRGCPGELPNVDMGKAASGVLPTSPVSRIMDAIPVRVEVEEHLEVSGRAYEREDDPEMSIAVEDDAWPDGPVEGMESVIVSVSGYEGIDRQNLVKLINRTGAAFTGQLSKANTHLVCWKFHGKKFDRAMQLHKPVINHQWFEDSLRAGKRLSESPYKLCSGEEVGLLKWKETLPPLVTERDEPSDGATNQHRIDHGAFFSSTMGQEGQRGHRPVCAASDQRDLPGTSKQAALPIVESGRTGGRKKSRRLVKLSAEQGNLFRENPTAPLTSTGEPYQRRTGGTADALEGGYYNRRRKSDSSALHDSVQVHRHDTKRRKSASSISERCIDDQERGAVGNLRGRARCQSSAGPDTEFTVINLSDDVDEGLREIGLQIPQLASAPATEGINADTNRGKNPECSQFSQRDREVACAICLVEAKSPSEGLLECGHKFCYKCIFTWAIRATKGPSCPLCKASCDFITRQEVDSSGKLDETLVVVGKKEIGSSSGSQRTFVLDAACIQCGNNDAESMLMRCGTCGNRAIHTFCMDPPTPPPWNCPACTENEQRDSRRLAWNQFLPGSSTAGHIDSEVRPLASNVRRRSTQPYTFRRPSRPVPTYRPSLHAELTQSMGPVRRTNIVGQHSIRAWLNNESSNGSP